MKAIMFYILYYVNFDIMQEIFLKNIINTTVITLAYKCSIHRLSLKEETRSSLFLFTERTFKRYENSQTVD